MRIDPDIALLGVIERQFGIFTRSQALAAGHTARTIQYRLQTGRWIELHRGVYALAGSDRSWRSEQLAACFWARGPAAGRAAGFLYGLPGCESPPFEVLTTDRHKVMPRCGIVVHLTNRLPRCQVDEVERIPVTSVERTLLDLSGRQRRREAAMALDNALVRGLTTLGALDHCLQLVAKRGRNGCAVLRQLVRAREQIEGVPTTPLETVVFELLRRSSVLPPPQLQHEIRNNSGSFVARPDFVFPDAKLVVEGHSRLWHEGFQAKKEDVERHERLVDADHQVIYVTWADATVNGDQTLGMIERIYEERRVLFTEKRRYLCSS